MIQCSRRLVRKLSKAATHWLRRYVATLTNLQASPDRSLVDQFREEDEPKLLNEWVSISAASRCFRLGTQLHSAVLKLGFLPNVYLSTALVNMYCKCWKPGEAYDLFEEMPHRNRVTWGSLLLGMMNVGWPEMAVSLFRDMRKDGVEVSPISISVCLVGCCQLEDRVLGDQVHGLVLKYGGNDIVSTNLIDLYSKCYEVENARRVFDDARRVFGDDLGKNAVTWTAMVSGYVQNQKPDEAMRLVREMIHLGVECNDITYSSLLSSFHGRDYYDCCHQVHCRVIRLGFESNAYVAASLVTVYSKCGGPLDEFRKACAGAHRCDQVSWNAVLGGYCNLGLLCEALQCFCEMRQVGIDGDFYAFPSLLGAIGNSSALYEGKQIHAVILKIGYASNMSVQNGLVSMYAGCGTISDSKTVFQSMEQQDVISWNALLTGYAHHGHGSDVVELFERMKKTGVRPNSTTFLVVLSACSHAGLVNKGFEYFEFMRSCGILEHLREEHYSAFVDILARTGHLKEAESFISEMPTKPGPTIYRSLLSACKLHGNTEIAARTAKTLLKAWPTDPATYVLVSSALAREGYWDDAAHVRGLMSDRRVTKNPGYSWT